MMAKTILSDKSFQMNIFQYVVTGRAVPTETNPEPKIYRMIIFARNKVVAKSRFWYFMRKLNKVKKSCGQLLDVEEILEEDTETVKNYGIWLRYDSRTGTHNIYKEFRDLSINGAVSQLYMEMAARHRAAGCSIQIMKFRELKPEEVKKPHILQLFDKNLKFPHIRRKPMSPRRYRPLFVAKRTQTFFN